MIGGENEQSLQDLWDINKRSNFMSWDEKRKKGKGKNSILLKNIKKKLKTLKLGKRYKSTDSRSQGNPKQSKSK